MNEPNLRYTKGMPITIAHFVQAEQVDGQNTLFLAGMHEEIKN
jgi:hypothetical protein